MFCLSLQLCLFFSHKMMKLYFFLTDWRHIHRKNTLEISSSVFLKYWWNKLPWILSNCSFTPKSYILRKDRIRIFAFIPARRFPIKFTQFLKTPYFTEHLQWMLLFNSSHGVGISDVETRIRFFFPWQFLSFWQGFLRN